MTVKIIIKVFLKSTLAKISKPDNICAVNSKVVDPNTLKYRSPIKVLRTKAQI